MHSHHTNSKQFCIVKKLLAQTSTGWRDISQGFSTTYSMHISFAIQLLPLLLLATFSTCIAFHYASRTQSVIFPRLTATHWLTELKFLLDFDFSWQSLEVVEFSWPSFGVFFCFLFCYRIFAKPLTPSKAKEIQSPLNKFA